MRILAFLTLPLLAAASMPAFAMDNVPAYGPLSNATPSASARARPKAIRRYTAHHRAARRMDAVNGGSGLLITDFKPDSQHGYASQAYLPHVSELAYDSNDYANRMWRLKKVGPGGLVASVKYRF